MSETKITCESLDEDVAALRGYIETHVPDSSRDTLLGALSRIVNAFADQLSGVQIIGKELDLHDQRFDARMSTWWQEALAICHAVESLPASEQQTKLSVTAAAHHQSLQKVVHGLATLRTRKAEQ